jgi:hypothetical protein
VTANFLRCVLALACLAPLPFAQSGGAQAGEKKADGTVQLEVRVGTGERGFALIDRGSADKLEVGDVVLFRPKEGGTYQGRVISLEERAARVELVDPALTPAAGTRGKVQIPRARFPAAAKPGVRPAPKRVTPPAEGEAPVVFENTDEAWQEGEPLLARVRPVRPAERPRTWHGYHYLGLDWIESSEDDRTDVFARAGTSVWVENAFGHGGRLNLDGEWNARRVDVPDLDDEEDVELRVERLSYAWGGDRFEPSGWEVGRFLQRGMVEFGVLDGIERVVRTRAGHRYGASLGFLPEPDEEYRTGQDLQLATFYEWVFDESEELSAAAGYQKSFHDGATDRDLVVARVQRLPHEGWTMFCTTWIDVYTDGDDEKGTLFGLTQAYLSAGKRWENGSSLDLVLSHLEFPEMERDEFLDVTDDQLADDHSERLALRSRLALGRSLRLVSGLGGWVDEDDRGGDAEIGFLFDRFLGEAGFADLRAFATGGRFVTSLGARASFGRFTRGGTFALDYEFAQDRIAGFAANNDDLPQHRVALRAERRSFLGWDLALRLEGVLYDDEVAGTAAVYLQRSF